MMELVFFRMPSISSLPDLFVATDAAGSVGFGYRLVCRSLAFGLVLDLYHPSAAFAPVVAAGVWGNRWHRLNVQFLCDNAVVVAIYIPGHRNAAADALSRLHFQEFPGPDLPIVGLHAI